MDTNHSSCWNSILEKVKQNTPTMDMDFSAPETQEIVAIHQRPAGLSLEVPEDFSFSLEYPELEEQLKPIAQTSRPDDILKQLDDAETVEDTPQWYTQCSDAAVVAGESKCMVVTDASLKPDNTKSNAPILSFARLDQWDLDDVLKNMKFDRLSMPRCISVETVKSHADAEESQSKVTNILHRLSAFCNNQSVSEPAENPNCVRQDNVWNKSLAKMGAELPTSHQEHPTVYIDLRCPDPSLKPVRTSPNLSSEFKLAGKHNSPKEKTTAKKHNLKDHAGSQMNGREVTGKSVLLQKLREMSRNGNKHPDKCTVRPKAEEMKGKPPLTVESICGHDSRHLWEDQQFSPLQSRKPKMESPLYAQGISFQEPQQQSDQQKRPIKHPEQDQEILKQLESHRPAKSVYLQQPAAERTDVLYEFEVSHQESISTLPENIESQGWMLLSVSLSSPGMVGCMKAASGKRKHLHSAETKSHIYNTLVAWFLSLAGPDSCHTEDTVGAKVPFRVAGLQQLRTENGLALHVLAVAHHCYTSKKRDLNINAPSYNHVCRFLSDTSLTAIASWLPQFKSLLDQQPFTSPICLPSSSLNCFISTTFSKKVIDKTFGLSPGFYWLTAETQELFFKGKESKQELHTEVSVALGCSGFFQNPLITHYTLHLLLDSGLDVCGLRLLYPPQRLLRESGLLPVNQRADEPCQPVLALAVRGPHAHSSLKNITAALRPLLLKKTEETSVDFRGVRNQEPSLIHCSQLTGQVHRELCLWFSGRLQGGSAQNPNRHLSRSAVNVANRSKSHSTTLHLCWQFKSNHCNKRALEDTSYFIYSLYEVSTDFQVEPSDDRIRGSQFTISRSSSLLCATTKALGELLILPSSLIADLLLVVSPVVPPRFYGQVLVTCERRGFSLMGLQRLQLQSNAATVLGLTGQQVEPFTQSCQKDCVSRETIETTEIASYTCLCLDGFFTSLQVTVFCSPPPSIPDQAELKPSHCLVLLLRKENMSRHSVTLPSALMREFRAQKLLGCLDSAELSLCFHTAPYNKNMFNIFVRRMWAVPNPSGVILSHRKCSPESDAEQVLTLTLCGKDMSQNLNLLHRVLTQGSEGDTRHAGLELLGLKWLPVLTRHQAQELSPYEVGEQLFQKSVEDLMSTSALVCALRAIDAFSSTRKRLLLSYPHNLTVLMSPTPEVALRQASLLFFDHEIILDRQVLFTVCLFKPRVWNHALAEIFCELQQSGLTMAGLRVVTQNKSDATSHLLAESEQYLRSGSLALCLRGENAVKRLLDVLRQEDASLWLTCYGSRSYQQAIKDVKALFPEGLCCTETSTMRQEQIPILCSDPVASAERKQSCTLNVAQDSLSALRPHGGSLIHRALWQTTCLLVPLKAPPHSQTHSQLEIVEQLLRSGCHLVAGRMSILDNEQRKHIAEILTVSLGGRAKMAYAYTAWCLIVALQGEMIVAGLRPMLERIYQDRPDLSEQVGKKVVYPESENEAKQLIRYLFDASSPESCDTAAP
ncbi:dynein axonemal assembly factor 8 [Odontesthes bonariensis]|uniref:dynein axonemal assembly factor 8 n=1 Tax=Odontesthes bonariensis TaxID=219752 RepID=UPI003F589E33